MISPKLYFLALLALSAVTVLVRLLVGLRASAHSAPPDSITTSSPPFLDAPDMDMSNFINVIPVLDRPGPSFSVVLYKTAQETALTLETLELSRQTDYAKFMRMIDAHCGNVSQEGKANIFCKWLLPYRKIEDNLRRIADWVAVPIRDYMADTFCNRHQKPLENIIVNVREVLDLNPADLAYSFHHLRKSHLCMEEAELYEQVRHWTKLPKPPVRDRILCAENDPEYLEMRLFSFIYQHVSSFSVQFLRVKMP